MKGSWVPGQTSPQTLESQLCKCLVKHHSTRPLFSDEETEAPGVEQSAQGWTNHGCAVPLKAHVFRGEHCPRHQKSQREDSLLSGAITGHSVLSRPQFPLLLHFQLVFGFLGQRVHSSVEKRDRGHPRNQGARDGGVPNGQCLPLS